jgi:hypothetical protein
MPLPAHRNETENRHVSGASRTAGVIGQPVFGRGILRGPGLPDAALHFRQLEWRPDIVTLIALFGFIV